MVNKNANITNIMIIGAMKCGTSSFFNYLSVHPEICPCITKEPEYFSEKLGDPKYKSSNYEDLFPFDEGVHKFTLEASTGYTKYPTESKVAKNIFDYGLSPKFIYIIRNPFDRIESHWNYMQVSGSWSAKIDSKQLINTSNYFLQLERYKKYFPIEDFLILDFDDLKNNPKSMLQDVYNFIGISKSNLPEKLNTSNQTVVRNKIELSFIKNFGNVLPLIPKPLKIFATKAIREFLGTNKKKITSEQRKNIHKALRKDMLRLQNNYGFNVSKWGFKAK